MPTPARRLISSSVAPGALLGEGLAGRGDELVVVAARVGALRARREGGQVGGRGVGGRSHVQIVLDKTEAPSV